MDKALQDELKAKREVDLSKEIGGDSGTLGTSRGEYLRRRLKEKDCKRSRVLQ